MLLPHGTVIALVDGENLELYRNAGDEAEPELESLVLPKLDSRNHSGVSHHSSAGNHADRMVSEDAHAAATATWLNSQVLEHRISSLVIFAAPRTLGELRKHFHKVTAGKILREYHKDLVGKPKAEIIKALREKA